MVDGIRSAGPYKTGPYLPELGSLISTDLSQPAVPVPQPADPTPGGDTARAGRRHPAGSGRWRQSQASGAVRFGLLGPLQISQDGVELPVRGGKLRKLLVALLLDAGGLVPADRLVAALWGGKAPRGRR